MGTGLARAMAKKKERNQQTHLGRDADGRTARRQQTRTRAHSDFLGRKECHTTHMYMSEGGRRTPTPPHAQLAPHHPVLLGGAGRKKEFFQPSRTPLCVQLFRPLTGAARAGHPLDATRAGRAGRLLGSWLLLPAGSVPSLDQLHQVRLRCKSERRRQGVL